MMFATTQRLITSVLVALGVTVSMSAQREIGIVAGGAMNLHSASFSKLGSFPSCCPEFTGGSGFGFYGGGWYGLPLGSRLSLLGRVTFSTESGTMTDEEISFVADLRDSARLVEATFTHELQASLSSLGIEPLLAYRVAGGLDVMAGARLAMTLSTSFHQTETLTKPEDYGAYLGDDRVWVDTEANIPEASALRATLVGGLRYVLPIGRGRSSFLAPEITYHLPLTGVAGGVSWDVAQVRFGIALGWMQEDDTTQPTVTEPPIAVAPPPPVRILPPPTAVLASRGSMPDGTVIDPAVVTIEETRITTLHPLIGHIYFDEGSSTLPKRYVDGIARASSDTIGLQPLEAAHGELAILAQRLRSRPDVKVRLTGTAAGTATDNGTALARARAEAIRTTLVGLGVNASRIEVNARATPALPTRASEADLVPLAEAENRRVEIVTSDRSLTAPVALGSTDLSVQPPMLTLESSIWAGGDRARAEIVVQRAGRELVRRTVEPRSTTTVPVDLETFPDLTADTTPFLVTLTVRDSLDRVVVEADTIPVRSSSASKGRVENLGDVQIERFALILFEFNDVSIRGENAELLTYIRSRLRPGTTVRVIGMTDTMGSAEYNTDLSLRRAREVARMLNIPDVRVEGLGESAPSFPNELPEGRALNRTVIVELVHPAP